MSAQQSLELSTDDGGSEHPLLWARVPSTTARMAPNLPTTTLRMVKPTLVREPTAPPLLAAPPELAPPLLAPTIAPPIPAPPVARLPQPPGVMTSWQKLDRRVVMLLDPDSSRAASFRLLADNLAAKRLPRVIAVSSVAKHDGKTTCAVNLALALAEHTAKRLLLVDANFFVPALAGVFAIDEHESPKPSPHVPWVAPYKLGALTPCLHVATIVRKRGEALPRLDYRTLTRLVESFCNAGYEHVILDAPALEGAAASQLVGTADGVLLAIRSGHTTARGLRRAVTEVGRDKMLGTVLMDARP